VLSRLFQESILRLWASRECLRGQRDPECFKQDGLSLPTCSLCETASPLPTRDILFRSGTPVNSYSITQLSRHVSSCVLRYGETHVSEHEVFFHMACVRRCPCIGDWSERQVNGACSCQTRHVGLYKKASRRWDPCWDSRTLIKELTTILRLLFCGMREGIGSIHLS
jgi:hypothetical protein